VDHLVGERIARDDLLGVPRAIGRGRDRAQHDGAAIDAMAIVIAIQDDAYAGEREIDHDKRVKIYQQIQDIMVDDAPALFLWDRLAVLAFRDRAKGDLYGGAHMENFANVWVTDGK
jgi:hypothetical protein